MSAKTRRYDKNYQTSISSVAKKLIDTPFLLVPFNLEDTVQNFPNLLKMQKTDSEIFRSYLMSLMMIYDIRVGIYRDTETLKSRFPIKLDDSDLILNQQYYLKGINIY